VNGFEEDIEQFLKTDVKVAALSAGTAVGIPAKPIKYHK